MLTDEMLCFLPTESLDALSVFQTDDAERLGETVESFTLISFGEAGSTRRRSVSTQSTRGEIAWQPINRPSFVLLTYLAYAIAHSLPSLRGMLTDLHVTSRLALSDLFTSRLGAFVTAHPPIQHAVRRVYVLDHCAAPHCSLLHHVFLDESESHTNHQINLKSRWIASAAKLGRAPVAVHPDTALLPKESLPVCLAHQPDTQPAR